MKVLNSLAIGFFVTIITDCLLVSYRFVNSESSELICGLLVLFNVLFISLFFQLNGSRILKVGILTIGNIIGLFWNLLFYTLLEEICGCFSLQFDAAYTIASPILNLLWIVPFWSISLSYLPRLQPYQNQGQGTL
jgi:hypothetical protein